MKKVEILMLNNAIKDIKMGKASKECLFALLDVKLRLSSVVKDIEDSRKTAADELKPDGEETEEMKKLWNEKFMEFFDKFLSEDVPVKFDKISKADLYELVKENDLKLEQIEIINKLVNTDDSNLNKTA